MGKCNTMKKMWNLIDYKGKNEIYQDKKLDESVTNRYFTDSFKPKKIISTPTIDNIRKRLENYEMYIPILNDPPDMYELDIYPK